MQAENAKKDANRDSAGKQGIMSKVNAGGEEAPRGAAFGANALQGADAAPLYVAVKQLIHDRIDSGKWPPSYRIPSENELVSELGVSRMTANRALRELASEGVIKRVQGVGSFVAERKGGTALFEVRNIADEIRKRGHEHTARIVRMQKDSASPEISDALGVGIGETIYHSIIVHYENGVPAQVEDRYVNPGVAPDYTEQDFTRTTPYAYLTAIAPLWQAEHVVEAVLPQGWEAKLLAISPADPCLLIRRRTWSAARCVTAVRLLYPGARYRMEGFFNTQSRS